MGVRKVRTKASGKRLPRKKAAATRRGVLPHSNATEEMFNPETLDRTVIAIPLLRELAEELRKRGRPIVRAIIVDLNLEFPGGRDKAREYVTRKLEQLCQRQRHRSNKEKLTSKRGTTSFDDVDPDSDFMVEQYLFADLRGNTIRELVAADADEQDELKREVIAGAPFARAIYHIWPDFPVHRLTNYSISTVKADAARASFAAAGEGIIWAVLDSGIQADHPHFKTHKNLELKAPLLARDFTGERNTTTDPKGHGTHVAGIIAGQGIPRPKAMDKSPANAEEQDMIRAVVRSRNQQGDTKFSTIEIAAISGMAPKAKLLNFRVLDSEGNGRVSSIISAISKIQQINGYGRRLLIHGVNLSVGNDFDPEWFACGQSPLCVEVNRLVKSGVVVVVAAGNSGYGSLQTQFTDTVSMGLALTINDPGNADLAITVGSTHRNMPHTYGVSYFSSKGPTGDGRLKPDLVAPGEKIISCSAGENREAAKNEVGNDCDYVEDSGTSMAAPHVSGVIAAFLSVRREFIGNPERVKEIFLNSATDLQRERYFQGHGLVDLMRAIQSI
jgi:serine protease AprX